MANLPELHYCCACGSYLGPDNCDGICLECEEGICDGCGCPVEICECEATQGE